MKSPAFQVYVNDFLGSTKVGVMSTEEIGAYWLLLFLDWQEAGFVYDETALSRWCRLTPGRFRKAWVALAPCFTLRDGRMYNPRLEKERTKQEAWRAKSARGGQASAAVRWGEQDKGGGKGGYDSAQPLGNTPLPLPSPLPTKTDYPADFELVWNAYPKREGSNSKAAALKAYNARIREGVDFTVMQDGTLRYAEFARVKAWIGTEFVMQASRFYGPDKGFLEDWTVAAPNLGIVKLWDVMKTYGFAGATRFTIEADLARAALDGKVTDGEAFKRTLRKLNLAALKDTRSDEAAHRIIAEGLAGSAVEGMAA